MMDTEFSHLHIMAMTTHTRQKQDTLFGYGLNNMFELLMLFPNYHLQTVNYFEHIVNYYLQYQCRVTSQGQ